MTITLALAGDTMLGRGVAARIRRTGPLGLVAPEIRQITRAADLFVLNLECCVSARGSPWPDPAKPFFFRAPPTATDTLSWLGVDCVTLANNHALDFQRTALLDTLTHLHDAGIATVGAGRDVEQARRPVVLTRSGLRVGVLGITDHPVDFAAAPERPGVAHAALQQGVPDWLVDRIDRLQRQADLVLVTPHWGPNMVPGPLAYVRRAAADLVAAGATVVAGHSAHVFHGVAGLGARPVLFDLGDFLDDYAVHPVLRNDRGLLFLLTLDADGPQALTAFPLALETAHTRLATGAEYAWVRDRFTAACAQLGTTVTDRGDRLEVRW